MGEGITADISAGVGGFHCEIEGETGETGETGEKGDTIGPGVHVESVGAPITMPPTMPLYCGSDIGAGVGAGISAGVGISR